MYRGIRIALRSLCAFVATLSLAQTVTFTPDLLTNNSFLFNGAVAADLNNDGREDLITTCGSGSGNGQFAVNLSTGDGVYAPQVCYSLPSGRPTASQWATLIATAILISSWPMEPTPFTNI